MLTELILAVVSIPCCLLLIDVHAGQASPSLTGAQWGWLLAVFNASLDEPVDEDVSKCNARYENHINDQHALPGINLKGIPPATSRCHGRAGTRANLMRRSVCNPRLAKI